MPAPLNGGFRDWHIPCPRCGSPMTKRSRHCHRCTYEMRRAKGLGRFWSQVAKGKPDQCWEWQGFRTPEGYGMYSRRGVHRIAYELANGKIPDGLWVLHRCDNPACCNPAHLFLGTCQDNVADMMRKGRNVPPIGSRSGTAKLNEESVRMIRLTYAKGGGSQRELARQYGVSQRTVCQIIRREHWAHVE